MKETKTYPDGWSRQVKTFNSYTVTRYVELHRPDGFSVDAWYTRFPRLRASLGWRRHSTYGRWSTVFWPSVVATVALFATLGFPWAWTGLLPYALAALSAYQMTKEKDRGRHRQTEADHRDPGDTTGTQGGAGGTTQATQGSGSGLIASLPLTARQLQGAVFSTAVFSPFHVSGLPEHPPVDLDVVQDDMPILAHRWAYLDFTSEPRFRSLNSTSGTFGVHSTAECRGVTTLYATSHHEAPQPDCRCGFYAVPADILPDWDQSGAVELQVQLSGRVIEHERGYRAQHQTVLAAVAPSCPCGKPSVRAWVLGGTVQLWDCARHEVAVEAVAVALTLGDLSSALGVPFRAAK